jgi:RimJ/RimL family protein N-acetyltransferase
MISAFLEWIKPPILLSGKYIRLEPLSETHIVNLTSAAKDPTIWQFMLYGNIETEMDMRAWVKMLLEKQEQGTDLPFAVIFNETEKAIGATRYLEIRPEHRSLEIGGTWYSPDFQRTPVNTECKYLLLRHAFEILGCIRVQFKTDSRNVRSQRALERIGAVKEGILRHHMITPDGFFRDSVYYSIIDKEWQEKKRHLEKLLTREY